MLIFPKKAAKTFSQKDETDRYSIKSFSVMGMTCMSCAKKIETVLLKHSGVAEAAVDFGSQEATVRFIPEKVNLEELMRSVGNVGYTASESKPVNEENTQNKIWRLSELNLKPKHFFIGSLASLSVIGFYLGLITLTSDWYFARVQFEEYRWWIFALSIGLGVQAVLFSLLREKLRGKIAMKGAKSSLAASGGMSAASMAACCAHYLVALLPALGLPFLSAAAAGLERYQVFFFLLGVLSNLFGIGFMLRLMAKNGMIFSGISSGFNFGLPRS